MVRSRGRPAAAYGKTTKILPRHHQLRRAASSRFSCVRDSVGTPPGARQEGRLQHFDWRPRRAGRTLGRKEKQFTTPPARSRRAEGTLGAPLARRIEQDRRPQDGRGLGAREKRSHNGKLDPMKVAPTHAGRPSTTHILHTQPEHLSAHPEGPWE